MYCGGVRQVGQYLVQHMLDRGYEVVNVCADFALFMVAALENDTLIHQAPAIVGCQTPSALAHAADQ